MRASNDRWLFGYADVVTLLFACFATLYASEIAPKPPPPPVTVTPPPAPAVENLETSDHEPVAQPDPELEKEFSQLASRETNAAPLELAESSRGLVLSLPETGSFPAGLPELTTSARSVLLTVANAIRRVPNFVRVEGHTDDTPIHTPLFASNWELSTARATAVVKFLIDEGDVPPSRLSAAGYADYRPRVPNDSLESRARNRRVDIVVLDAAAAKFEEPTGARP